jgi:segregation and condensation protein B
MTEQDMKPEVEQALVPEQSLISVDQLRQIIEAALLAAGQPLSQAQLLSLFTEAEQPGRADLAKALQQISDDCVNRGIELTEVASGFRLQVKQSLNEWVKRLWSERPQRYSRALLETLALIAYRQPITRGEIESVRGVSVRTSIIRTLQEREWIRVVGHRDVPGKPALFATTKAFLDYFNLKTLDDMPNLAEIRDIDSLEPELDLEPVIPAIAAEPADGEEDAADDGLDEEETKQGLQDQHNEDADETGEREEQP